MIASVNSKGKHKVRSWRLHTWHLISKHTVRNGFPCNKNAKIHWQLPVFTEQISLLLICSLPGHCSETQRHLRRCKVSTERWQLGVCTQPQTKQHSGRHSKLPAHFTYNESLNIWGLKATYVSEALRRRALKSRSLSEYIAEVLKGPSLAAGPVCQSEDSYFMT